MAGLTDMEELIASVDDKAVANYLREALACYGAGAYRACIVMSHIALFDGLRRKIKALAPVSAVAKAVSEAIEPLADAQKVFETPLIQRLKSASIITQLEAERLQQLNDQRNKAAHPSGHLPSAEEARFVFSEVITKFLNQPIRETSYVVDRILDRIADGNFFPSAIMNEMDKVVAQETADLADAAIPSLIARLSKVRDLNAQPAAINASNFLAVLASRREAGLRGSLIKHLIEPKASDDKSAEFLSTLATCDPSLLSAVAPAVRLRYRALLLRNAQTLGSTTPFIEFRSPARVLMETLNVLGEDFMLKEMSDFVACVISGPPYIPEFVANLRKHPTVFKQLHAEYLKHAGSSTFDVANAFAKAVPSIDVPLARVASGEEALSLIAAISRPAASGAFGAIDLKTGTFRGIPSLRAKAKAYAEEDAAAAASVLSGWLGPSDAASFIKKYLS